VDYIERDQVMYTSETQRGATWGLARISHRRKLTLGTFNKYEYDSDGGKDVTVYVIDTGVYVDHKDFEGRATWGKTIPSGDDDVDGNGHGSHCAGTIAGKTYGVAKKANIVAVKVLRSNGSGSMSDVVGGIVFASEQHLERQKSEGSKYRGSVANMSLGGGKSRALDDAVTRAIKTGLHFAVAAGNDNKDACNYSPANVETAVTVGASTLSDDRAYFSNHGECVDIFAPGLNIKSVWNNGGTNTISGTSMASPHVAGLIAYYLSIAPASTSAFHSGPMTPSEMKAYLIERATDGALSDLPKNTVNKLIYNNIVDSAFYAW
ncbi:serine protease, partial [Lunasporangiospora selenospora]